MEELLKEIMQSIKYRKNGIEEQSYDINLGKYITKKANPSKGKGTKAYITRRIDILIDKLQELKKDIKDGKYDYMN